MRRLHYAHSGVVSSLSRPRECTCWPGMSSGIQQFIETCDVCRAYDKTEPPVRGLCIMCSVLTSLVFHKNDKPFAINSGEFCSSFVLFDCVFRSLSMTSIRGSIHHGHEAFSEHSRGRQSAFVSLAALLFLVAEY